MVNIQLRVLLSATATEKPFGLLWTVVAEAVVVKGNVIFYPLENGNHKIPLTHRGQSPPPSPSFRSVCTARMVRLAGSSFPSEVIKEHID